MFEWKNQFYCPAPSNNQGPGRERPKILTLPPCQLSMFLPDGGASLDGVFEPAINPARRQHKTVLRARAELFLAEAVAAPAPSVDKITKYVNYRY